MLYSYMDKKPTLGKDVFIADGAKIIGDVHIGDGASIWYNSVLRGDIASIYIGKRSNIQDLSVIHVNTNVSVVVEDDVSVGHSVTLHGCTIKKGSMIGMGSTILNGAIIEEGSLVAAGSLITENKHFPPHVLIMGSPAKVVRELTPEEVNALKTTADRYCQRAQEHRENIPLPITDF
ncbi:MAG TPA: gamma carbonic anhydrase family protein [Desulfitobacterium dehalogenans]|uniref:Gamma carbonic anhydrase family protein n=1 Tax=Desulfitobacterium dehalogenans TaxID=36854 RepID=A0A7C7DCN9_9FIRM|nr:gamma carbonic anhydrase family protein [Desulfitobacterium dehalogenans]